MISSFFALWSVSIIYEVICIALLSIGLSTLNIKMLKYYLKTFDLYYKMVMWALYIAADFVWWNTSLSLDYEMNALMWVNYALQRVMFTIIIIFILCIDAYHITHKYKVRAFTVVMVLLVYFLFCMFTQVHALNPTKQWHDRLHFVPVLGKHVSLKALLMAPLLNLIIFTCKQFILIILHPNKAMLQVYPSIRWIEK